MRGWLQKITKRRRHKNGWVTGYRTSEWWIGARRNFACDWLEIGFLGFSLCISDETRRRKR